MKVLWITSRPIAGTCGTKGSASSGSWLDAAFESCSKADGLELGVASVGAVKEIKEYHEGKHSFYVLPGGSRVDYKVKSMKNIACWNKLRSMFNPDIIQIWGTEKGYYKLAQDVFHDKPCIIYIQGVLAKIAEEYSAGLSGWTKFVNTSLQDILRGTSINKTQRRFYKLAKTEKALLLQSDGVIVENDWCEDQINAIAPDKKVFRSKLPIKDVFFKQEWEFQNIVPHTIFTNAGAAPIKGHHILFKALSLVVKKYPDVKILIPGFNRMGNSLKDRLAQSGYSRYLRRLIYRYDLTQNIEYLGVLNSEEMAEAIAKANIFVMPSCIENHSSSLIEAMIVGAPCISSFVGGVGSIAVHKKNALLYNFPDAESLAGSICRLLDDINLLLSISEEAKNIRQDRKVDLAEDFIGIYKSVLSRE